ncbi:amidase [Microbacterium sp. YY-03]|uniref:amidase n=1 Tax=Microbacterium sp. YY-03 TaxID=3421636 RepID=UPI003D18586D
MSVLHDISARGLARQLNQRSVSPRIVTEHYLRRIAAHNDRVGAFVEVTADAAHERLAAVLPDAVRGPLWAVPFGDKDLSARAGIATRYGSAAFRSFVPEASDPLVTALDATGGISLGKTATPEFGMTGYTESAVSAPTRNPWDLSTGAGGSSGGAAAAVAAGLLPWAPGSDGGGSIRIPAATVGIVGLKPSRGRMPIGSGLDSPDGLAVSGPLARSVADIRFLYGVMRTLAPLPYAVSAPEVALPTTLRVGVTTVSPWDDDTDIVLDDDAAAAVAWAADVLTAATEVSEAHWQPTGYPDLFRTLWRASAARIPVHGTKLANVEPITRWLIEEGRALSSEHLLGAYAAARVFEKQSIAAFSGYDAVLTPVIAQSPRPVGWFDAEDAEKNFTQQVQYAPYTSWVNVAGLPAISVPVTMSQSGQPVSVQLVGRPGGEEALFALAEVLEQARGPLAHPPVWYEK